MMDDKYVVFKREDFEQAMSALRLEVGDDGIVEDVKGRSVEDAVVLRLQDRFSEHGLRAYAGALITAVDVLAEAPVDAQVDGEIERLARMADRFNDLADRARQHRITGQSKTPD